MAAAWTDEQKEQLKLLWADKSKFTKDIADILGVSKNAVIGAAHRLGLDKRKEWSLLARGPRGRTDHGGGAVRRRLSKQASCAPREIVPPVAPLNISLLDLRIGHCRWVVGNAQDGIALFCGHAQETGSFCGFHAQLVYERAA